jgi:hypothetical protein
MSQERTFGLGIINYANLYTHRDDVRRIELYYAEVADYGDSRLNEMIAQYGELGLFVRFTSPNALSVQRTVERLRQSTASIKEYYFTLLEQGMMAVAGDLRLLLSHAAEGRYPDLFDAAADSGKDSVITHRFIPILDKINELTEALRKVSE